MTREEIIKELEKQMKLLSKLSKSALLVEYSIELSREIRSICELLLEHSY